MMKTTMAAFGALVLVAGCAQAAPPPNAATGVWEGGGVYYNPFLPKRQPQPQSESESKSGEKTVVGTTFEGGGVYHLPADQPQG
jgi:hypothetical protein